MCLLEVKNSCPQYESICEERKADSSHSGILKLYLFFHVKYLLQYKYFDGWGKRFCRGVRCCGRSELQAIELSGQREKMNH